MSHYVVDGVGFCAFMDRWAEQCRLLCCADTGSIARQREFSFDRDIISKMLSPERRPLSKAASRMFFVPSLAADLLAWISPEWRGRILSFFAAMGNVEAHVFHVSKESLEDVRRSLSCFVPSDIRLSDNDLIASLASMTIVSGQHKATSGGILSRLMSVGSRILGRNKAARDHVTFLIADMRHRLGIENSGYTGNCAMSQLVVNSLQRMQAPSTLEAHAQVACRVRAAVRDFDSPYISQFVDSMSKQPSCFTRPLVYAITHPDKVFISNQSRFPLYKPDFGFGIPAW
ncbi:hypothetical protein GGI02_006177, partial [Coemansia sp. RSA 2322]